MTRHIKKVTSAILAFILLAAVPMQARAEQKRSMDRITAFAASFAVPGLGQYMLGSTGYARFFIAAELAVWGSYYYNNILKDASRQDFFSYAALHAGVNPAGNGESYLNAVGGYNSSFEHATYKLQGSKNPVLYTGSQAWNWDSEEHRMHFRRLREKELDYENNLKYCIAGAVLNHFVAGLHASKLAFKANAADKGKKAEKNNSYYSTVSIGVLDHGLKATYIRSY